MEKYVKTFFISFIPNDPHSTQADERYVLFPMLINLDALPSPKLFYLLNLQSPHSNQGSQVWYTRDIGEGNTQKKTAWCLSCLLNKKHGSARIFHSFLKIINSGHSLFHHIPCEDNSRGALSIQTLFQGNS